MLSVCELKRCQEAISIAVNHLLDTAEAASQSDDLGLVRSSLTLTAAAERYAAIGASIECKGHDKYGDVWDY